MRLKWAILVVALCVVVTVAAVAYAAGKATGEVPEVIRAKRFELVDADGRVRAALGLGRGQPVLAFADTGGKARVLLALSDDGTPGLGLADGDGEVRAVLRVRGDGSPSLELREEHEQTRATLEVSGDGDAMLRLFDKDGEAIWSAP